MRRRLTQANIARVLEGWPQAINADDSDLRVLHDMANAGAQRWGESLHWPDYLWLGLERPAPLSNDAAVERVGVRVPAPNGLGPDADLGVLSRAPFRATGTGLHPVAGRIDCILELKAITVDHVPRLQNFSPRMPWPKYLEKKLRDVFGGRLETGDRQIRDFRRVLGFPAARGVTLIVNEGSPSLNPDMVVAFLGRTTRELQHTDAVVYLSDRPDRPHASIISKLSGDDTLRRFKEEFFMMLHSVDWSADPPVVRGGPYPQLAIRIQMDEQSRSMYRTWSTGWRSTVDATPVPTPRPHVHIVRRDQYRSGLV